MKNFLIGFCLVLCSLCSFGQQPVKVIAMNAPQGPRNGEWATFQKYIVPEIDGVSLFCKWSDVETAPNKYDFSACDNHFQNFQSALARVNILSLVGDNTGNAVPSFYRNLFQTVSCSGTSYFPVVWDAEWQVKTENVIAAFIAHEKTQNRLYDRISITQYGQSSVPCQEQLQWAAGSANNYQKDIVASYQKQVNFEGYYKGSLQLQEEVSDGPNRDAVDYADAEAATDENNKIGIGSGGAQLQDTQNSKRASSDWVSLFDKYSNDGLIHMLQSYTQTDNKNLGQTGSLAVLLLFAVKHHLTSWEMYYQDLSCAFIPGYSDATGCHGGVSPLAYQQAIRSARSKFTIGTGSLIISKQANVFTNIAVE